MTSRRTLLAGLALSGCATPANDATRILARPGPSPAAPREAGLHPLKIRKDRDPLLYIPKSAKPQAPLLVYLHGATGSEQQGIRRLSSFADERGFVLLSPASADGTWDAIRGSYGEDVRTINECLVRTFAACRIDAARIGLCGFSDGASYALGLGLSNGDLFRAIMAYSPGFIPEGYKRVASPRVFISHGTNDQILPIDSCGRPVARKLKDQGYKVTFREFDGPHTVPKEITEESLTWFLS